MAKYVIVLFLVAGLNNFLPAQGLFESVSSEPKENEEEKTKFELNGFARGSAYGGSENYDYSNLFGEFALKGKLLNRKTFLFADVRFREGLFFNSREFQVQLKEAYAGFKGDKIDLYLGNQIVAWGRADGFNPTNCITPNDYFFLTYNNDDQKLSNFMLRGKFRFTGSTELDVIAIPFYMPSIYRYDLFSMGEGANFNPVDLPKTEFDNSTFAARLNFELPSLGFSLSYFYGYDPFYGFNIDNYSVMPLVINYKPIPYRKNAVGLDFAIPIKSLIVRGEMAYSQTKDYETNMHIPNPDIYYVFGIEKSLLEITAIFQYIGRYTFDFKDLQEPILGGQTPADYFLYASEMIPYESTLYNRKTFNQQEETNHALMVSLNRSFLYNELGVELTGYYNITSEEYLIRPSVKWSATDNLAATFGGHFMFGPEESIFDKTGKVMSGVFVGLEVNF
jgi:hypothetical protein